MRWKHFGVVSISLVDYQGIYRCFTKKKKITCLNFFVVFCLFLFTQQSQKSIISKLLTFLQKLGMAEKENQIFMKISQ